MESGVIRPPAHAGSFYPETKEKLLVLLQSYFANTKKLAGKNIKALIVPHAGYIYSGEVAAWGFKQLPSKVKHLVLVGPSHYSLFQGLAVSNAKYWQTPLGKIRHLTPQSLPVNITKNDSVHSPEHCLEVELPFLLYLLKNFSITCFLTGTDINTKDIAQYLLQAFPDSVYIFSSDLSHYLPEKEARQKDKETIKQILKLNSNYLINEDNAACGSTGITILLEMARLHKWSGKLIKYNTSATTTQDTTKVVGYATITFQ